MTAQIRCLGHTWFALCPDGCCRQCLACGDHSAGGHVGQPIVRSGRVTGWDARPLHLTSRGEHALIAALLLLLLIALAVVGRVEGSA